MRNLQNQFKIYGNTAIRHMQTSNRLDLDKKCRAHLLLDHARIVLLRHCRIFAVTVARSHVRMRNRRKKKKYMGHHARPARKSPSGANRGPALLSQRVRVRNQFSSRRKHACVPPKLKQLHWNAIMMHKNDWPGTPHNCPGPWLFPVAVSPTASPAPRASSLLPDA